MKKSIEHKIRLNAVLAYFIIAALCAAMVLYIYNAKEEIDSHRQYVEQYYHTLTLTNELAYAINQAQSEANFYVISKEISHLHHFKEKLSSVGLLIDTLVSHSVNDTTQLIQLADIRLLLTQKGEIVTALNQQLKEQNPLDSISKKLQQYALLNLVDSLIVGAQQQDTIVNTTPQRNFWQRVGNVFNPAKSVDTITKVSTMALDTLIVTPNHRQQLLAEINRNMAQASRKYNYRITAIEREIARLILTDQEISLQISTLLNQLHRQTITTTLAKIKQSEAHIARNHNLIIIGGVIALSLILIFVLLIINDVNKGHAARKALEQANERTKQIMESRHRLLLSVSHDIKTPLNSILGYLELWNDSACIDKKALASMQNSGKHILALLENLLEFSSLEQGTLQVTESGFNLHDLCSETIEMFRPLAQQKKLTFQTSLLFDQSLSVYADRLKVKQIIINILSNAIKYTVKGEISFTVKMENDMVLFNINDTGAGIPQDQIDNIFKPFVRATNNTSLAEGSGLGLFVVKGLVELLKGQIAIKSTVGQGTLINVSIPMKKAEINTVFKAKQVLVVDDDPTILSMLKEMLVKLGHSVSICNTPSGFSDYIKHISDYDVIITDMEMDSITGKDILTQIKQHNRTIPVIIMTGRSDFHNITAAAYGFDGYLAKPIDLSSLAMILGSKTSTPIALTSLEEMFDNDQEAIRKLLTIFVTSTVESIAALDSAVKKNDYYTAQHLCHKMLPMFLQLGISNVSSLLKKMDAARDKSYTQWQEDARLIIEGCKTACKEIRKYLQGEEVKG